MRKVCSAAVQLTLNLFLILVKIKVFHLFVLLATTINLKLNLGSKISHVALNYLLYINEI